MPKPGATYMGADSVPLGGVTPPPPPSLNPPLEEGSSRPTPCAPSALVPHVALCKTPPHPKCSRHCLSVAVKHPRVRTLSCFPRKDTPFSVVLAPGGRCHPLGEGGKESHVLFWSRVQTVSMARILGILSKILALGLFLFPACSDGPFPPCCTCRNKNSLTLVQNSGHGSELQPCPETGVPRS